MKTFIAFPFVLCLLMLSGLIWCEDAAKSEQSSSGALSKKLGDENVVLSVVKGLVEFASNGFKTGLEASMRSIFNKPVTSAVYALSMLVGVVAMLAFYESPISPMPVPSLPDPPVGRFPPEHPVWPPVNQGPNQMAYNGRRTGSASFTPNFVPAMAQSNNGYYAFAGENNRSDKNQNVMHRNKAANAIVAPHLNETSYNNYISKLTSSLNLGGGTSSTANVNLAQGVDRLKNVYGSNFDLSNKVIDYNNKRMAVESLKYNSNNNNQNQTVHS